MPKPGPPRGRVPRRAGVVRGCPAGPVVRLRAPGGSPAAGAGKVAGTRDKLGRSPGR